MVSQARRFNRIVTQRVGALNDHFLSRDRPLGEARVLWEIGPEGRDLRSLRADLELDSGYLSRLLRSLEVAALITVGPKESDRRVRIARLTPLGLKERKVLDQRSDDLAASLLAPLNAGQSARLVAAMADVERLLTAAMVEIDIIGRGRGTAPLHYEGYGIAQEESRERFDEALDFILAAWGSESFSFEGKYFHARELTIIPVEHVDEVLRHALVLENPDAFFRTVETTKIEAPGNTPQTAV